MLKIEPRFFSPASEMLKPQSRRSLLSRVYNLVIQISQLQFFIAISNLFSCENTQVLLRLRHLNSKKLGAYKDG